MSDDEVQSYIGCQLEKENREICKVDVFGDGLDFLDKYKHSYNVIFTDIDIPHFDGLQASRRLRERDDVVSLVFVTNMMHFVIFVFAPFP